MFPRLIDTLQRRIASHSRWFFTASFALSTGIAAETASTAETESDVVVLEKLQVSERNAAAKAETLQNAAKDLSKIAGGTSLVTAAELEKGRVATPEDLLAFQPGVFAQSAGGTDAIKISIRGSSLNSTPGYFRDGVLFLFDGLPITGPGGTPYELFETYGLNYTSVLRGANAFSYGALTFGGAINFVTHSGFSSPGIRIRGEAGSFGWWKAQLAVGGVQDKADYFVSVTASRRDGFQTFSYAETQGVAANLGYAFNDRIQTRLYIRHREQFNENPGALTLAQLKADASQANASSVAGQSSSTKPGSTWIGSKTTVTISPDSRLVFGVVSHDYPQILSINGVNPNYWIWRDINSSLLYSREDQLGEHRSESSLGVFYSITPKSGVDTYEKTVRADGTTPFGAYGHLAKTVRYNHSHDFVLNLGNEFELTRALWLSSGLGLSHIRRIGEVRFTDRPIAAFTPTWNYYAWNLAPRGGLRYEVLKDLTVFANVSRSIDPYSSWKVSGSGVANNYAKPLREQKGTTVETGVKGRVGRFEGGLSVYRSWIKRELLSEEILPAIGTQPAIVSESNASPTIHQGVELGLNTLLWKAGDSLAQTDQVVLRQSYTYNDFHYRGDRFFAKNRLPGLPDHVYQVELQYQQRGGFYAGVSSTVASNFYVDYTNTYRAPSYKILGGRIGYDSPGGRWKVYLDAKNLTDEAYATTTVPSRTATAASAVLYPGDGRSVFAGFDLRF